MGGPRVFNIGKEGKGGGGGGVIRRSATGPFLQLEANANDFSRRTELSASGHQKGPVCFFRN